MTALPRPERRILTASEAAEYIGYSGATAAFYGYCDRIGVEPLPDRKGAYDRLAIDRALDRASGLVAGSDYGAVKYGGAGVR